MKSVVSGGVAARLRIAAALAVVLSGACETPTDLPPPPKQASAGTVSGQVVVTLPGSSEQLPSVGAKVQLLSTSVATTTDAEGRFLLSPITQSSGAILIQADPNGSGVYQHQELFDLATINAGPGHDVSLGTVVLSQNAIVIGRAVKGDDPTASTGQGGTAVFVPQGPFTTYTGDNGSYELDNLPSGTITLTFFRSGYAPATIANVVLQPGEALQLADVLLTPAPMSGPMTTGILSGQVTFSPPVADDTLTEAVALGTAQQTPFTVGADGTYDVTLPEGVYTLQFGYAGYLSALIANVLVLPATTSPVPTVTLVPAPAMADAGPPPADAGPGSDAGPMMSSFAAPMAIIASTGAVRPGDRMSLNGSESTAEFAPSGLYLSYAWTQTAGTDVSGSFSTNDSVLAGNLSFTAPATPQTLGFQLVVTDTRTGLTGSASTTVQVVSPPVAVVSPLAQTVYPGTVVTFDGSQSTDPSGSVVTYDWTTTSPAINLSGQASQSAVTFAAPEAAGSYTVQLVVSDPLFTSDPVTATVTVVLSPPVARIATLGVVASGSTGTLDGSQSTADSAPPGLYLSFAWTQTQGTAVAFSDNNSVTASSPTFVAPAVPVPQTLGFALTVTDTRSMLTGSATTTMQVINPPVARVTPSTQTANPGVLVTFDGSGSTDPSGDAVTYTWSSNSSDINLAAQASQPSITFTAPTTPGAYTVQLVVSDPLATSAPVTATLNVAYGAPVARIASPGVVPVGGVLQLNGAVSSAENAAPGLYLSYHWAQTEGDAVTFSENDSVTASAPTFTAPDTIETLGFQLTVTDTRTGGAGSTTTTVLVVDPPVAVVTPSTQTVHPGASVTFSGASSVDPTGGALSYTWSSMSAGISLAGQTTASAVTFTAPATPGTYALELVVNDPLLTSAPVEAELDVVTADVAPTLTLPPSESVAAGSVVELSVTGSATDPIAYAWTQTSGSPVSLANANTATATFTAPDEYAHLVFQVTGTSAGGTTTASIAVDVIDTQAPQIVASDPPSDGAPGPWLMATATFNVALNPATVTAANAFITDSAAATVASTVEYEAPTRTLRVVPLVPLVSGNAYVLHIGAVQDTSPTPNVFPGETLHFAARPITWTTWSDANTSSSPPNPGVAANDQEVFVFATYTSPSPCTSASAIAAYAVPLSPAPTGDFAASLPCSAMSALPSGKRGLNVGGTLYGVEEDDQWNFANSEPLTLAQAVSGGFNSIGGPGAYPIAEFTDGTQLYNIDGYGYRMNYYAWLPDSDSWSATQVLFAPQSEQVFAAAGTGGNGDLYIAGRTSSAHLFIFESAGGAAWSLVSGSGVAGSVATIGAGDTGTGFIRATMAAQSPVFAWSTPDAVDDIDAAVLDSSTTPPTWQILSTLNEAGPAIYFDIAGRGNILWLAYVASDGLVRLRQTDLSTPSAPVTIDYRGPGGAAYLNVNAACAASHPELANLDGALYATWAESCAAGQYTVELRELQ